MPYLILRGQGWFHELGARRRLGLSGDDREQEVEPWSRVVCGVRKKPGRQSLLGWSQEQEVGSTLRADVENQDQPTWRPGHGWEPRPGRIRSIRTEDAGVGRIREKTRRRLEARGREQEVGLRSWSRGRWSWPKQGMETRLSPWDRLDDGIGCRGRGVRFAVGEAGVGFSWSWESEAGGGWEGFGGPKKTGDDWDSWEHSGAGVGLSEGGAGVVQSRGRRSEQPGKGAGSLRLDLGAGVGTANGARAGAGTASFGSCREGARSRGRSWDGRLQEPMLESGLGTVLEVRSRLGCLVHGVGRQQHGGWKPRENRDKHPEPGAAGIDLACSGSRGDASLDSAQCWGLPLIQTEAVWSLPGVQQRGRERETENWEQPTRNDGILTPKHLT